jgi:ribosomal protein S18 acetylase RimI-like enzyme
MTNVLEIKLATGDDVPWLIAQDYHLAPQVMAAKIGRGEILVAWLGETRIGWLRWNYFWDLLPFMNMLHIDEPHRGRGHGRAVVAHWENLMHSQGFTQVLTSTLANENAQHFYRRLGYHDIGALFMPGEAVEIILLKTV